MKDYKFSTTTGEGIAQITTPKIKGKLVAFILNSDAGISLNITSELGYSLFDINDTKDYNDYCPIQKFKIDNEGNQIREGTCFYIDEKLLITISGSKDKNFEIILRVM